MSHLKSNNPSGTVQLYQAECLTSRPIRDYNCLKLSVVIIETAEFTEIAEVSDGFGHGADVVHPGAEVGA